MSPKTMTTTPAPTPVDTRALVWKIDVHLVPVLCVLYLMAFLDRVNISNAALYGLQTDLHMSSTQYSTALVIFFVPYILFEIPSNILLKKLSPNVWLSLCMGMFGITTMCQGLVSSYGGLLTTRFFLGLFEAGMFPGCFYLLAMWYRREESMKRYTFFFCSTTLAGAFGGLLASAIGQMDGARGWRGWRWVFIIEGVATVVIAGFLFFLIPSFPEAARFLTEAEREVVKARLADDVGESHYEEDGQDLNKGVRRRKVQDVLAVFKDYKIFLGGLMYFGLIVPAYGYAYFAPTIIKGLGYTSIQAQLHSVPPWACAFFFAMITATLSDHLRHRYLFSVFTGALAAVGFIMLLTIHTNLHAMYAALFLVTCGAYTSMPILVCWFNTNLAGHTRRSVGSAWQVGFGNVGGIIASYSFPSEDAPRYTRGYALALAFVCLSIVASTAYCVGITLENKRRDKLQGVTGIDTERVSIGSEKASEKLEEEKERERERGRMGDLDVSYRYLR
ncbi:MFS transporter [Gloeophyllum trabeum ATCC 11539]|uniref:MFS transporter n=1 Tax=Gloeophyllum trabeum (strain ATCC 11539 / FP-39264 / Madison 617) TaxID=670483 RepID=S7PZX8_GLOTA|nr:MFS transporter [Gloeophyllum trabeum ATCC 11539]EPQ52842.1 MFS transporter [Gloeophyllum trabeum ATCC 11539]